MISFFQCRQDGTVRGAVLSELLHNGDFQRQYKVRVSGKMQLLQKKIKGNSPTQNNLTGQKQLLKRKEAALVTYSMRGGMPDTLTLY